MSALFCIKKTDPTAYSFRIEKKGSTNVVYGPACWSTTANLEHRMWLRDNGFDMGDIDRIEKILLLGSIRREDKDFLAVMNRRLTSNQMRLGLAQKQWCADELKRIVNMDGLDFAKSSNLAGALILWHHIKNPITENSKFHKAWAHVSSKNGDKGFKFIAEFLHWKLNTDDECRKDPSSCLKRYGIIIDKINY
jgi:hypothetical protein